MSASSIDFERQMPPVVLGGEVTDRGDIAFPPVPYELRIARDAILLAIAMGSDPEPVYAEVDQDLVFETSAPHLRLVRNDTAPDAEL